MSLLDATELILRAEDEEISRGLEDVRRPPIRRVSYSDILHGDKLPPQPELEFIDPMDLRVDKTLFLGLDLLNSIEEIEDPESAKARAEFLIKLMKTREEIFPEDHPKVYVALALPEKEHLETVKGRWTYYVWKDTAYDGSKTPSFEGWVRDISSIADTLRREGVKVRIYGGKSATILEEMGYDVTKVEFSNVLVKLGYPRDPSVTWSNSPIIMNMTLDQRRGEESVASQFFRKIGLYPVFRPRWWFNGRHLVRARAEGGNFILVKSEDRSVLFTGIGIRGSNRAAIELIREFLSIRGYDIEIYGVPLPGYIRNWRTGAVHLDVVMMHAGPSIILSPGRMGFYSLVKLDGGFDIVEAGHVFKELGMEVDEMPVRGSEITLVNALNLGNGKLVVDSFNAEASRYLEREWGLDIIEVSIPQIEAGGGGVRCATREYYPKE
ncbi:MAG: hypothetical protein J7J65_02365 [Candidatus Korarchaeota archaeon]|nr:hypothetical protein [Candidatus Korarchaeota archaeon]